MSLKDKVTIVTGSSSGIGAAIALKFAAEGAKVTIVGRNQKKLTEVAKEVEQKGSNPLIIVADVTKEDDCKKIVNETVKLFGKLDVLVNNAGIAGKCQIDEPHAMQLFDRVMATNFRSVVYLTHLAAPHIITTKGNIINISSVSGISAFAPGNFSYGSSKAALNHFTRCIAIDLGVKGVRVNAINPGPVKSDILTNAGADQATQAMLWKQMKKSTILNRIADAEEIAALAAFVASDAARGITGSTMVSDNGALLTSGLSCFDLNKV